MLRRSQPAKLHGRTEIERQRRQAQLMVWTGLGRCGFWMLLLIGFLLGLILAPFHPIDKLFALVAFTAAISTLSLVETSWGQVAASLAQLSALDAHHDAEATRREQHIDYAAIEGDIARLAALHPGPDAERLEQQIKERLRAGGV